MSKKLLSVVVALALVLSCFALVANAAAGFGFEEVDEDTGAIVGGYQQTWALSAPVETSAGVWTVDVLLTANYSVGPIQFQINNTDNTTAVLSNAVVGKDIPEKWNARVSYSNSTGKVVITPKPVDDAVDGIKNPNAAVVATLTYTVAAGSEAKINIVNAPKTEETPGGTLIAARMSDGNIVTGTPIIGQTVVSTGSAVGFGGAVEPELVVIDGTIGVIDTSLVDASGAVSSECDGYLFGIEPFNFETIDMVFEVVGDGYMKAIDISGTEYVDGDISSCVAGTGTKVQVLDNSDNVVAEYVVVVFGDVDGNGEVTTDDASFIELSSGWAYEDEDGNIGQFKYDYEHVAACVDGCQYHTTDDASFVELSAGYAYEDDFGNGYKLQETVLADYGIY